MEFLDAILFRPSDLKPILYFQNFKTALKDAVFYISNSPGTRRFCDICEKRALAAIAIEMCKNKMGS